MPGLNARELLASVESMCSVPIVFMSGYTENSVVNQDILDGKLPFLHKPFSKRSLLEKIEEVLRSSEVYAARHRAPS